MQTAIGMGELDECVPIGPQIIASAIEKIKKIQERLEIVQSNQESYVRPLSTRSRV